MPSAARIFRQRHGLATLALFVLAFAQPAFAQRWSPDGRWLAFVHAHSPAAQFHGAHELQWLLGSDSQETKADSATRVERLWAVLVSSGEPVLLDETSGNLTEAAWSGDGSSVAYGRLITGNDPAQPTKRFELIFQNDLDRKRVVVQWACPNPDASLTAHARGDVALSRDASLVVAPSIDPPGLNLVQVSDGQILKTFPRASRPAWSDNNLLAFVEIGAPGRVVVFDSRTSKLIPVAEIANSAAALPAARWAADGRTVYVPSWTPDGNPTLQRHRLSEDGTARDGDPIRLSGPPPAAKARTPRFEVGLDHDRQQLFQILDETSGGSTVSWIRRPQTGEVYKRFNPFLETVPLSGLAVCPRPGMLLLALRPSALDPTIPAGICDPDRADSLPLAPDEPSRSAWLRLLYDSVDEIIDRALPAHSRDGWRDARPVRVPIPGDLEPTDPSQIRLVRLAKLGRALLDQPIDSPSNESRREPDDWARLTFDYLAGDHQAALRALDRLELRVEDPDSRARLLGFRAQIHIAAKKLDAAAPMLDYMTDVAKAPPDASAPPPPMPWLVSLKQRLSDASRPPDEADPSAIGISFPRQQEPDDELRELRPNVPPGGDGR